jgi:hypothetical protein
MSIVVYAECHVFYYCSECHYAECRHGECRHGECHHAECRGAPYPIDDHKMFISSSANINLR